MKAFFVVVLFAAVIAAVSAACNRVDVNVSDSSELEAALLKAQPGTNIILAKGQGFYSGSKLFVLKASGVKDCPIVIGCETPGDAVFRTPFDISQSSFVTVSNVTMTDSTDSHGFNLDGCTDVIIENVHVTGFNGNGIHVEDSKRVTIRNCTIDHLEARSYSILPRGIFFRTTVESTIERCTFGDNIDSSPISFYDGCSNNVISENIFYGTSKWHYGWIRLDNPCEGCTNNEISRNFFENPGDRVTVEGIDLSCASNSIVRENLMIFHGSKYLTDEAIKVADSQQRVCASNRVFGSTNITNGVIDPSC